MESWASLNVLFVGVWQEEADFSLELSTIELPWQVIHDIVLPPVGSANIPDIGLFVLAPLHRIFIQSHYHNLLECSQRAAFPKGLRMPENAPCCVLEVLQPSAVWQFALVSRSLPVPSLLNIRQAAKQHNVVQLTCSSHNLAPVCCTIHMVNLSPFSHSSTCLLFSFFSIFWLSNPLRQTQFFSSSLSLLSIIFIFSRRTFSTLSHFSCSFSLPGNIRTHFWPFN